MVYGSSISDEWYFLAFHLRPTPRVPELSSDVRPQALGIRPTNPELMTRTIIWPTCGQLLLTLLQNAIPPGLNRLEQYIYPGSFYLLFSTRNREKTQSPVVLDLPLLRCTPGLTRHALSRLRAWPTVEHQLRTTMQNIKVCCMLYARRRRTITPPPTCHWR